jgi:hypothetical protein
MTVYHIDFLMEDGKIYATTTIFCPDDGEAIAWVTAMMVDADAYPIAKVRQGTKLIAELP